jgi:hypothetical protein
MVRAVPWSSEAWIAYYESNNCTLLRLPWEGGADWTPAEQEALVPSLCDFQLGESSEGNHLRARAKTYANVTGDLAYADAIGWFIREEQRHSATLAEFLRAAGVPLAEHTWLDAAFRWFRQRAGLELFLCVLLTAEMIGKIYYRAVHQATQSILLRGICTQLLRDEVRHLRFHRERLARMRRQRTRLRMWLAFALHRVFYKGTCLAVWLKHRRAFRAAGLGFLRFWSLCDQEWQAHRRQSHPDYFDFAPHHSACGSPKLAEVQS